MLSAVRSATPRTARLPRRQLRKSSSSPSISFSVKPRPSGYLKNISGLQIGKAAASCASRKCSCRVGTRLPPCHLVDKSGKIIVFDSMLHKTLQIGISKFLAAFQMKNDVLIVSLGAVELVHFLWLRSMRIQQEQHQ